MAKKPLLSYILHKTTLISVIGVIGIAAVLYGMLSNNDLIFIVGLVFVIGGYLLIRRIIKEYVKKNV